MINCETKDHLQDFDWLKVKDCDWLKVEACDWLRAEDESFSFVEEYLRNETLRHWKSEIVVAKNDKEIWTL